MLQTGECKFSICQDTKNLWEKLKKESHETDFQQLFWRTQQGIFVTQTLRRRGIKASSVKIEQRPEDSFEYVYIQTKP